MGKVLFERELVRMGVSFALFVLKMGPGCILCAVAKPFDPPCSRQHTETCPRQEARSMDYIWGAGGRNKDCLGRGQKKGDAYFLVFFFYASSTQAQTSPTPPIAVVSEPSPHVVGTDSSRHLAFFFLVFFGFLLFAPSLREANRGVGWGRGGREEKTREEHRARWRWLHRAHMIGGGKGWSVSGKGCRRIDWEGAGASQGILLAV